MEEKSDWKVQTVMIGEVFDHPNADRLDLVRLEGMGWQCVVQKGKYQPGDVVVYIPIDSILTEELEAEIFGVDSKVKLHKRRVRTIKLRGAISQGLIVETDICKSTVKLGQDVTKKLGIVKHEPPAPKFQQRIGKSTKHHHNNPFFKKYTKMPNFKYYIKLFEPEDDVIITEKIHGTNFRAGWAPYHATTLWEKAKKFLGMTPKWQFVYGSHNMQISRKPNYKGFYEKNVYAEAVEKYNLKDVIPKGYVIYGEIYGAGIQKNYNYGKTDGRGLVVFDVMNSETSEYLDYLDFKFSVQRVMGLPMVPVLHFGKWKSIEIDKIVDGVSMLNPAQKIREGCVVKSQKEEPSYVGRKALKVVNPEYLLKDQTEWH